MKIKLYLYYLLVNFLWLMSARLGEKYCLIVFLSLLVQIYYLENFSF